MKSKEVKQFYNNIESINDSSLLTKDVEISCAITFRKVQSNVTTINEINCTDLVPMIKSIQEGHKCFTFFSDIYGQVTRSIKHSSSLLLQFDQFPQIHLKVGGWLFATNSHDSTIEKKNQQKELSLTGMYMNIHDPTILPDMYDMTFHQLVPGKFTNVPFVKRVQKLLPSPYKTQCYEYGISNQNDLDHYNMERLRFEVLTKAGGELSNDGLSIYRTRGECLLYCMWRILNTNKCVNFYSIYTEKIYNNDVGGRAINILRSTLANISSQKFNLENDQVFRIKNNVIKKNYDINNLIRICIKTDESFEKYIQTKYQCLKTCPDACIVETFMEDSIIDENQEVPIETTARINIQWAPKAIINIVHRPKLDISEFLGTLGGQAHIWLGISVIQLIWNIVNFVQSLEIIPPKTSCCELIQYWRNYIVPKNLDKKA